MILEHIGLKEINGSLVVLDDVDNASNEDIPNGCLGSQ